MIISDDEVSGTAWVSRPTPPDPVTRSHEKLTKLLATGTVGEVWKAHFPNAPLPDYLRAVGERRFSQVIRPQLTDFLENIVRDTLTDDLPEAIETILGGRR